MQTRYGRHWELIPPGSVDGNYTLLDFLPKSLQAIAYNKPDLKPCVTTRNHEATHGLHFLTQHHDFDLPDFISG